jgi:hypothetical protein
MSRKELSQTPAAIKARRYRRNKKLRQQEDLRAMNGTPAVTADASQTAPVTGAAGAPGAAPEGAAAPATPRAPRRARKASPPPEKTATVTEPPAEPGRLLHAVEQAIISAAFVALATAGALGSYHLLRGTLAYTFGAPADGAAGAILMIAAEITFGELCMLLAKAALKAVNPAVKAVSFVGAAAMASLVL